MVDHIGQIGPERVKLRDFTKPMKFWEKGVGKEIGQIL
jgi:hypothetical protein